MSKPWSQAGTEAEWSEWRALFRNYAIGIAIAAALLWGAGFQCARVHYTRPDPAIAGEQRHAQALRDSLRTEKHRSDSIGVALVLLKAHVALDSATAAVLERTADAKTAGITVDTSRHFLPIARDTGSRSAADSAADTVSYAAVRRPIDAKPFLVPRYFAEAFLAKTSKAAAFQQLARSEHALNLSNDARAALDSTRLETSASLNASLARQVDALNRRRAPWCGAKCGAGLTLAALAAAAITLHEVRR